MIVKLIRWFIFNIIIALLPIYFNCLYLLILGLQPTIEVLTGHGELLLISAAIAAVAIGEQVGSGRYLLILKLGAVGGCVIMLLGASFCFAVVSTSIQSEQVIQTNIVANISIYLFLGAIVSSGSCLALAQVKQ